MKILEFPNYITINSDKELSRNTSGYGYMTIDIATSIVEQGIEVDLLTQSYFTNGKKYKGVNILKRGWPELLLNIKLKNLFDALNLIFVDKINLKKVPNVLLYYLSMGYFERIIKNNKYDLVHIHGIGYYTKPIIETCNRLKIKYIVTLHGLKSFSESINISSAEKEMEKQFLINASTNRIPVSVISTGIRKLILNYLKKRNDFANFFVITNGVEINKNSILKIDIRQKYKISDQKKIMLCIGNISKRKNQIQVIDAFERLPETKKNTLVILFLGNDATNGIFNKIINDFGLQTNLIVCGNIPRETLFAYYEQADFNIVASKSEGFGLSMIEGFAFGLPTLTYADLDAIPDIYHEDAMILTNKRTDEAMAKGIEKILDKKWDKNFIKLHAQSFSLDEMAKKYIEIMNLIVV